MKTYLHPLILIAIACFALAACDSQTKRMQQAQTLYEEGVQLREQRRSEEAAEKFLQGLAIVQRSDKTAETVQLEGQLCDNLGAMYLKHGLFEDAFKQHQQALNCFKQTADSSGMMNAYRNSGRAVRAQEQFTQAKQYYDSAFRVATFINDQAMLADLYLEMGIETAGGGSLCATIHHSDCGTQYAFYWYVDTFVEHHIRISMTECYNPTDNAIAERMNGILKTGWIYHQELFAN